MSLLETIAPVTEPRGDPGVTRRVSPRPVVRASGPPLASNARKRFAELKRGGAAPFSRPGGSNEARVVVLHPRDRMAPEPEPRSDAPKRRTLRSRVWSWSAQVAVLVVVVALVSAWQTRSHAAGPAPDFALRDLDGATVRLSELRGKRVLLHFWATWCGVCAMEPGALNAVQARLDPDEALLAVAANGEDVAEVRRFAEEHGVRYRILLGDESVVRAYRVGAFPTNYFITRDGQVSSSSVGFSTRLSLWARMAWAR